MTEQAPRLPANFATIVKLLILTGQRRNEIASLQSSWLHYTKHHSEIGLTSHGDTAAQTGGLHIGQYSKPVDLWQITLPKEITKNRREHTFPICQLTYLLLPKPTSEAVTTGSARVLFPARGAKGSAAKPFNGWSKSKKALDKLALLTEVHLLLTMKEVGGMCRFVFS
jgi:integrase